jgi:fibronectin type 3 domain-containing protein/TolB-like protein
MGGLMGKKVCHCVCIFLLLITFVFPAPAISNETPQIKVSVFNFSTVDLEASGYNTVVTNMLMSRLSAEPSFALLDRKELEAFLSMNDLQQDDNLEHVVNIGSRLGLNAIVVGSVWKRGSVIIIHCKVIHIGQKCIIFETRARALGNAGLEEEIKKLSTSITEAIDDSVLKYQKEIGKATIQGPLNMQKRSGAQWVSLNWEAPPGMAVSGYEIYRSKAESGPFTKIAQVNQPEYHDQELERNTRYYYKIRAYSATGIQSDFSTIIPAETALTPNSPIILNAEGHIKSIELMWSPSPIASEDKLSLKGYKLYRAKTQQGPYKEVANIPSKDPGAGVETVASPDKLLKVIYLDKGLTDGENYYYKLTAYNEKNLESDFCSCIKGATLPIVSGVSAHGDMIREIKLMWNLADSLFIKGYYLYRSTSDNGNYTKINKVSVSDAGGEKKTEYTDREGLQDNTRYFYRITAIEDSGMETSPSVTVSAITKGKPATLRGFKAQRGLEKKIELTWPVSQSEEVEGYNLYMSKEKDGKFSLLKRIDDRTINSFVHGGGFEKLDDNATYYYSIRTFNKVNVESDPSETISATTKPRPAKPSGLNGEALKVKEVPLTWRPNPEKDIAVYHIYRSTGSEDFSQIAKITGKTNYQDKDLKDGSKYRYKIRAEDKDELLSDFSDAVSVQTKPKPRKLEGITGDIREGNAVLSWQPGSEPDLTHYVVYEKSLFGLQKIDTVKKTSFSEAAPAKGKSKTYAVTSVDKDGLESEPSQQVTIGEQ